MGQRELTDGAQARRQLGRRRLQELEPGGRVEEEVVHLHARADLRRHAEPQGDHAALAAQPKALGGAAGAAGHREARDRADRRQRLAAEAERGDRVQVLVARQLGGRVALERQRQLLGRHAVAVVRDPDQRRPAIAQIHRDRARRRVQRVLHQFLHRRRRPLDDLAGRDLVDERIREPTDPHHVRREGAVATWPGGSAPRSG